MPKPSLYALIWSQAHQHYHLENQGGPKQCFSASDAGAFPSFLDEHTAFAFVGQAGRMSVLKEARRGGRGYWYACRTHHRQTHKRYLGPSSRVTFEHLEEVASQLASISALPELPPSSSQSPQVALLGVKLAPLRLPIMLVQRERLLRSLDAALTHPLTLISASAGSGKTTLLSAWTAAFMSPQIHKSCEAGEEPTVAWLCLEELDNDLIRFWTTCIGTLQRALPTLGQTALALLHAQEALPLSTCLISLLQEIEQVEKELILILDDYQVISEQTVTESMRFLLDHLPANLHLVLATRTDPELPLARLRVRQHLLEIRDFDLRFTREEAATFLRDGMGLPLSEDEVETLQMRTEGWIAGLQLAALSLSRHEDLPASLANFTGSHHFVLDYVQQDILAHLPDTLQEFVLQTSILTRMSADLCQAVTVLPGAVACQELLETLERTHLFVVPLDEHRRWYRYHDLFREALQAWLQASQPELVPMLHQRAAHYYEAEGQWHEAIVHALASPDYALAADLMEQAAPAFWLSGNAAMVQNWVLMLPDATLCDHTRLALDGMLCLLNSAQISTKEVYASVAALVERTILRLSTILHRNLVPCSRRHKGKSSNGGCVWCEP
jgi:LuxR family maltose regulon positive regulatory protein